MIPSKNLLGAPYFFHRLKYIKNIDNNLYTLMIKLKRHRNKRFYVFLVPWDNINIQVRLLANGNMFQNKNMRGKIKT